MPDPDYIYDPEEWESTYPWDDRHELAENVETWYEDIKRFETLVRGPDKWIVNVVLSWDGEDPDETEIQWFDSEAEAKAALEASLAKRGEGAS